MPTAASHDRPIVAVLCALAVVLTLASTWRGPGIIIDSVIYLSTGSSLADGSGLVTHEGERLTMWPPGLPAVLAAGEAVGLAGETTSRLLNAAAWATTIALAHLLGRRMIRRRAVLLGATALVAVSPVLLEYVASMVLTESAFIAVTLACVLVITRAWDRNRFTAIDIAALTLLCWTGFLLRYAAVGLIAFVAVAGFVVCRRQGLTRALGQAAIIGLSSSAIPALWMLRNRAVDGTLMGPRTSATATILDVAQQITPTVGRWLLPSDAVPLVARAMIGAGFLAFLGGSLIWLRYRTEPRPSPNPALAATALFGVVFTAYLAAAKLTTAFDALDSRLMSPLIVPLILVTAAVAEGISVELPGRRRKVDVALALFLMVQCVAVLTLTYRSGRDGGRHGAGLYAAPDEPSVTSETIARLTPGTVVYANDASLFWLQTRIQPVYPAPRQGLLHDIPLFRERERLAMRACDAEDLLLAWYDPVIWRGWYSLDELAEVVDLEELATAPDGTLYRVTAPACPGSA